MIKTESMTINGKAFVRTYSDSGCLVERDGVRYGEAIDPEELCRTYTETTERVEHEELTAEEALGIIVGGDGE